MTSYKKEYCPGCGAKLQNKDKNELGYIIDFDKRYCLRCFRLAHHNENILDSKISAENIYNLIKKTLRTNSYYYYIIDCYDIHGSRNKEIERLLQDEKVIIIINKFDLINKWINEDKLKSFFLSFFKKSSLNNVIDIVCVSANKKYNIKYLLNFSQKTKNNIYILGSSNVGKSSLINAFLKENKQDSNIVVSQYFNTTLDFIPINLSNSLNQIFDTPGLPNKANILNYIKLEDNKLMRINNLIKPVTYQLEDQQTIFYEGVASFNYLHGQKKGFHFFKSNNINLHRTKLENKDNYWKTHCENQKITLTTFDSLKDFVFVIDKDAEYSLHISGLGWVTFKAFKGEQISVTTSKNVKIVLDNKYL